LLYPGLSMADLFSLSSSTQPGLYHWCWMNASIFTKCSKVAMGYLLPASRRTKIISTNDRRNVSTLERRNFSIIRL
jgi:hypothetical protein